MSTTKLALSIGAAILASIAAVQPAAAHAKAWQETASQKVSIRDLDLSREADAKVLIDRVNRAARTVCTLVDYRLNTHTFDNDPCVRQARTEAIATLGNPSGDRDLREPFAHEAGFQELKPDCADHWRAGPAMQSRSAGPNASHLRVSGLQGRDSQPLKRRPPARDHESEGRAFRCSGRRFLFAAE